MNVRAHSQSAATWTEKPVPPERQARSNAGCGNCKKRKVKCDERKPSCSRCQIRRLTCPGYSTDKFKWSCKHEVYKLYQRPSGLRPERFQIPHQPIEEEAAPGKGNVHLKGSDNGNLARANPANLRLSALGNNEINSSPLDLGMPAYEHRNLWEHSSLIIMGSGPGSDPSATVRDTASAQIELVEDGRQHLPWTFQGNNHGECYGTHLHAQSLQGHNQIEPVLSTLSHAESSILSPAAYSDTRMINGLALSVHPSLLHVPTVLVEHYFQKVCRECSTFDSSYNPFRTMVSYMRMESASLNYTIQSLAAAKLAHDLPRMKIAGIEAQGLALQGLKKECSAVPALHKVSDAVLCTILLLGMTTSWHSPDDIGIEYLALARRIVTSKVQAQDAGSDLDFYQNALKYWTMIISIVSGGTDESGTIGSNHNAVMGPSRPSLHAKKIMPHPWTGISPVPLELFGDTLRLIRKTRSAHSKATPIFSRASISNMSNTITAAEQLETKCWATSIPSVDELSEFGDPDTPRIHHVLTAKAYLLSSLLHIYMVFPDVLECRIQSFSTNTTLQRVLDADLPTSDLPHILSSTYMWPRRRAGDPHSMWLRDIGFCIVECLEKIDVKSGTRVVHAPLLMCVANALTLSRDHEPDAAELYCAQPGRNPLPARNPPCVALQTSGDVDFQVRCYRSFIIKRLETMHAMMRFRAIDNVLTVIQEVWKRADAGSEDVFWMDIMHELRCETLFG